jgi:N-acetyl-anhydromuramyl-L-alanine amidase AmpD
MGLISLLIMVLLMILGAGYFLFGNSNSISVINDKHPSTLQEGVPIYEDVKNQALEVKNLVEQKAAEEINNDVSETADQLETKQTKENSKQETEEKTDDIKIINRLMISGFAVTEKPRAIDTIVLHSSYDLAGQNPYSVSGVIKEYEDYGVSAHYLIDREGTIYRLVEDKNIAYHAGVSQMSDGRKNVNDFSLGIELLNTLEGQYTEAQYEAVNNLVAHLKKQYPIKSIVGHNDIAPDRKTDPWNFDWKKLK